jgi:hypothetical protein
VEKITYAELVGLGIIIAILVMPADPSAWAALVAIIEAAAVVCYCCYATNKYRTTFICDSCKKGWCNSQIKKLYNGGKEKYFCPRCGEPITEQTE